MALTIASTALQGLEEPERLGRYLIRTRLWTLSSTYVTGGHAATAADLFGIGNLGTLVGIEFPDNLFRNATNAVIPVWAPAAGTARGTIMFFQTTTGAPIQLLEVANATSLASYAGRVRYKYLG